ncbi:EthD domain-containing protein [Pseudomonas sp. 273]|uniref:EthD domain-containing protein n=1 Tax=Pseudomonas sp. 273 TaxID=75692 RepID=UPI0023D83695|nr:EthD domain-containing protein [Pseudomonas sp. 273]
MNPVTTIALLSKKDGLSSPLFSKYWRDVHGVLAARIPGFESYVQFHLGAAVRGLPLSSHISRSILPTARFHGIAEVTFADAEARAGLASSEVAVHIQADERNVFKASLLYNLEPGASRIYLDNSSDTAASFFILLGRRTGRSENEFATTLERLLITLSNQAYISKLKIHNLASGDPSQWDTEGVDNCQTPATTFDAVLQVSGRDMDETLMSIRDAIENAPSGLFEGIGKLQLYPVAATYTMVLGGRPTQLGLRGLDALQTINATGAVNQLSETVTRCIYGISPSATLS